MKKFDANTLNKLLDDILDEYFEDDNVATLGEVIDYVKCKYEEEIKTLG